jgi:hypothetical protein
MELGLSLGETMADAGRDLVLGLGMGVGVRRDEEAEAAGREKVRRELEFVAGRRCGRSSPEPPVRLTLLPGLVPSGLGLPWPPSSETSSEYSMHAPSSGRVALSLRISFFPFFLLLLARGEIAEMARARLRQGIWRRRRAGST